MFGPDTTPVARTPRSGESAALETDQNCRIRPGLAEPV